MTAATVTARVEATEILVEVLHDLARDSGATAHLVLSGLTEDEWGDLGGIHTGPRSKVERVGPHSIEYRRGDL